MSPTTATATRMKPISSTERIQILDILRGFAVLGILAVNIGGFAAPSFYPGYVPPPMPWYDQAAHAFVQLFAEGKFYTIFSFLFGLGFAVQLQRAEAKGKDIRSFYPRRLLVLFAIGVLHSILLWSGDILRMYALWGFALLAFRRRSNRTLLIAAGLLFVLSFAALGLLGGQSGVNTGSPGGAEMQLADLARAAYTSSSIGDYFTFQLIASLVVFVFIALSQGPSVLALFLIGLLAGRSRIFERLDEHRALARRVAAVAFPVGLLANVLFVFTDGWTSAFGLTVGAPTLAAAYVAGLSLLSLRPAGARALAPMASVGRMALTNYVLQSLVCALLFYGIGFGLYEQVGAAGLLGITVAIYALQLPLSAWWLGRYRFGPLEWVWRTLTYGERPPMRVTPRSGDDPEPASPGHLLGSGQ